MLANPISTINWLNTHRYIRQLLECWFLAWRKSTPTLLTCLTMLAIALANGDWSSCDSRHLTTAVWKSTMRDKLENIINYIIQYQNSQVINKIFAGKKQNAKKLKSVQNVLDNPDPAWAKVISNPAPDPKKSHNSAGSDSKNPDPKQHWCGAQRWSDSGFLLSDPILFLKNDTRIRSESCFGRNHTIRIRKLSESVLWCTIYIFVLCLFCLVRQNNCWSYFAFSWTRLVKVVTWQVRNACPA